MKKSYLYTMAGTRKRKASKIKDKDPEGNLPQRSMKDIADKHAEQIPSSYDAWETKSTIGTKEDGKEAFDFVLKGMIKPDNQ